MNVSTKTIKEKYPVTYKVIKNMWLDCGSPVRLEDYTFVFKDSELELLEEKLGELEGKTIGDLLKIEDIQNQMRIQGLDFDANDHKDWDVFRKEDALEEYTCGMSIYIQALDRVVLGPEIGKLVADIFNQL